MSSKTCPHNYRESSADLGFTCCLACGDILDSQIDQPTPTEPQLEYTYEPLDTHSNSTTRLVVIAPGHEHDTVQCSVENVDLQQRPSYCAVSYTWATESGDVEKSETINIDGALLKVTKNCYAALRRLRKSGSQHRIWIDSICIDQSNVQERNHQVTLMERIYATASEVQVCIEHHSRNYSECMSWLNWGIRSNGLEDQQLEDLLSLRYFSRVWVIQELALAQRVILTVNGQSTELSNPTLWRINDICRKRKLEVPGPLEWVASRRSTATVFSCLRISLKASASDPRDKVYAILSLVEPSVRKMIPVDYSLCVEQVICNAIMASITISGNISIYAYAWLSQHGSSATHIFTIETLHRWLSQLLPLNMPPQFGWAHHSLWASHVNVQHHYLDTTNSQQLPDQRPVIRRLPGNISALSMLPYLQVRAHFIDLSAGRTIIEARQFGAALNLETMQEFRYLKMTSPERYNATIDRAMSYFRPYADPILAGDRMNQSWRDFKENSGIQEFLYELRKGTEWESSAQCTPISDCMDSSLEPSNQCRPLRHRNHIFFTNYSIGFTSVHHQPGDAVYALDGARHPFLLRETDQGKFRIVGICYLWAALDLDYWNPGTRKGLWPDRPVDLGSEQTRMIEIY